MNEQAPEPDLPPEEQRWRLPPIDESAYVQQPPSFWRVLGMLTLGGAAVVFGFIALKVEGLGDLSAVFFLLSVGCGATWYSLIQPPSND